MIEKRCRRFLLQYCYFDVILHHSNYMIGHTKLLCPWLECMLNLLTKKDGERFAFNVADKEIYVKGKTQLFKATQKIILREAGIRTLFSLSQSNVKNYTFVAPVLTLYQPTTKKILCQKNPKIYLCYQKTCSNSKVSTLQYEIHNCIYSYTI